MVENEYMEATFPTKVSVYFWVLGWFDLITVSHQLPYIATTSSMQLRTTHTIHAAHTTNKPIQKLSCNAAYARPQTSLLNENPR